MLMVVFGAGASYDSAPSHRPHSAQYQDPHAELRPPLANHLFDNRELFRPILEKFSRAQDVVQRLRHLQPNQTVESVMDALKAEAETDDRRPRQLAAIRHYLREAIWECTKEWNSHVARGVTNYKSLLDHIAHERKPDETVCLVTFNYDTMLEEALTTVDLQISAIRDYVKSKSYKVVKVHGSVNWGREVEPSATTSGALATTLCSTR